MSREVVLTADATADLLEIVDWISANDSPAGAGHVLARIESAVAGLSRFAQRGAYPHELLAAGVRDYRETAFKPYRIVYRVESKRVVVHLIADGRRDLRALLGRRLLEG
jgi:toxin ParE1/3/4